MAAAYLFTGQETRDRNTGFYELQGLEFEFGIAIAGDVV
jgi:hypothetical protein